MELAGDAVARLVSEVQAYKEHEEELSNEEEHFSTEVGGGNVVLY